MICDRLSFMSARSWELLNAGLAEQLALRAPLNITNLLMKIMKKTYGWHSFGLPRNMVGTVIAR